MIDPIDLKNNLKIISKELMKTGSNYHLVVSTNIDRVIDHLSNLEETSNTRRCK